ncbi:MAG: PEP-CTERM sorting domain-containing protein [Verrucomicrobia bacterium]|nr:PEP-CTERM sorting domain-containing protein [Verrucomicrobiota bacterium]MCH8513207.1 PEP-CTERM sorting domain-containing protein [Kiritimatiellia bacterium]
MKNAHPSRSLAFLFTALALMVFFGLPPSASAQEDLTWSNDAGTAAWNTADANWRDDVDTQTTFATDDHVFFTNVGAGTVNIAAGGVAPGSITFDASSTYTFTGGNITSGNMTLNGSGQVEFSGYSNLGFGDLTINNGTFRFGNSSLANNSIVSLGTGAITLNGGILSFGHNQGSNPGVTLSNNILVGVNGGEINTDRFGGGNPRTVFSGAVTLGGDLLLSKGGGGNNEPTITLGGTVTLTGGNHAIRGASNFANGAFPQITGNIVEDGTPRQLTLAMDTGGRQFVIGGTGNNWTGGTIIESGAGFIRVLAASSLGSGNVEIQSGGQLRIEGSGNIGAAATVSVAGGGVIGLGFAPTSSDLAKLNLSDNAGIALGANTSTAIDFSATGFNANARLGAYNNVNYSGTITPFGLTYRLGVSGVAGILTLNQENALTGARDLDVTGSFVNLTNANDYSGATNIGSGGTLRISHANAIANTPSIILAGGQIRPASGGTTTIEAPVFVTANSSMAGDHNDGVLVFANTVTLNANLSNAWGNNTQARGTYRFEDAISGSGSIDFGRPNSGSLNALELLADNSGWTGGLNLGNGGGNNLMTIRAGHDNAFGTERINQVGAVGDRGVFFEAVGGDRVVSNDLRISQSEAFGFTGDNNFTFDGNTEFANTNVRVVVEGDGVGTFSNIISTGTRNLRIAGEGTLQIGNAGYTGLTNIGEAFSDGGASHPGGSTLLVNGTMGTGGQVTVFDGAALGGTGSINRNVHFQSGAQFVFNPLGALTIDGNVTFAGFGIEDVVGLENWMVFDTYTLINGNGNIDFTNISNVGEDNAHLFGDGRKAYFKEGSLQVVLIPEPGTLALILLAMTTGLVTYRRKH